MPPWLANYNSAAVGDPRHSGQPCIWPLARAVDASMRPCQVDTEVWLSGVLPPLWLANNNDADAGVHLRARAAGAPWRLVVARHPNAQRRTAQEQP
jgi:hypothetical protein